MEREISNFQAAHEGQMVITNSKLQQLTQRHSGLSEKASGLEMPRMIGDQHDTIPRMTLREGRRLNEQHMALLKEQRELEAQQEAQLFRYEKQDVLNEAQKAAHET